MAPEGWLVVSAVHGGGRGRAYENEFTAAPADRQFRLPNETRRPKISDSLPARVVSPGDYQYAYIDDKGRYRVRLPFDLDKWSPGGDSRPVRLGKPYAGPAYGLHFPLHEGAEVRLSFAEGSPDRPYISGVMHDSLNPDHVPDTWNTRNVIRTWADNKLRMEDKKGEEHIKLSTEYQKTQLNLGHLVDGSREKRGEGLELRTDGWGALRTGAGLFLSADARPGAQGRQLAMDEALAVLGGAVSAVKALAEVARQAQSTAPDLEKLETAETELKDLQKPGILASAPEGVAAGAPTDITLRGARHGSLGASGALLVKTGEALLANAANSLTALANAGGLGQRASAGPVRYAAYRKNLEAASKEEARLTSSQASVALEGAKEVILASGGAYIKLGDGGIELGAPGEITFKCASWTRQGPNEIKPELPNMPILDGYNLRFHFVDDDNVPYAHTKFTAYLADGTTKTGTTDKDGYTISFYTENQEDIKIHLHI